MDLPSCPACGQSVLDDDTDECPFCGASMSGKPSAGGAAVSKAPSRPAAAAAPEKKGKPAATASRAAASASKGSSPGKAQKAAGDDPFETEGTAAVKAIQLLPAPRPGRQWEVICPMCETPGYTATKASGREVRCANSGCLVPVFTAPEYEAPVAPPEPEPEKARWPIVAGVTLAGCALVAAVGYFALFYDSEGGLSEKDLGAPFVRNAPEPKDDPENPDGTGESPGVELNPFDTTSGGGNSDQTARAGDLPAAAELPGTMLAELVKESQQAPPSQKAASRRLIAEAYAQLGQLEAAREQLAQLDKVRRNSLEFYRIPPLTRIAWRQLVDGEAAAAKQTLDEALQAASQLESFGRVPLDYATLLSGALVAANRASEA
ncbi:MAG: hypothetical protein KDA79_25070, partial [Planctomycetaceae bacterium]|nr:hypothetical protein [Planctomycetaceae bacterium]